MREPLNLLASRWPWLTSLGVHTLVLGGGLIVTASWRDAAGPQLRLRAETAALAQAASAPPEASEVEIEEVDPPPLPSPDWPTPPAENDAVTEDLPPLAEEQAPWAVPSDPFRPPAPELRTRRPVKVAAIEPPPPRPPVDPVPTPVRVAPGPLSSASAGAPLVEGAVPHGTDRPPPYPPVARAGGQMGVVVLVLEVDAAGAVVSARVERSSGFPLLDDAARVAALGWRFQPARVGGIPVPITLRQKVRFTLDR